MDLNSPESNSQTTLQENAARQATPNQIATNPLPSTGDPLPCANPDATTGLQSSGPNALSAAEAAGHSSQGPTEPFYRNYLFFGAFGLRALWSLLIYLAIVGAFVGSLFFLSHQIRQAGEQAAKAAATRTGKPAPPASAFSFSPNPKQPLPMAIMITSEVVLFSGFFFFSWLMASIERRPISVFGLGGERPIARLLTGAFWGLLAISTLIFTLHGLHLLVFDSRLDRGGSILFWGLIQLFGFFLVGLSEEYIFRGYIQFTLTRGLIAVGNLFSARHARAIAFWIASVITSSIFLIAHKPNHGEDWYGLTLVFLIGLVFVLALWRTGSLWWGIGFHMAWDWGQSFLYGVPDSGGLMQGRLFATHALGRPLLSGGTVGPEGSILCIPVVLLILPVLYLTHSSPHPSMEVDA
ncbi:MAG: CPBP family intramembrane glutamic endopeptidase [Acidobacteriaceae bacterium]